MADGIPQSEGDALSPLGIRHIEMPATPERLWRAIRGARN
jgi:aerobic carbon-monoxide dehydrogenase large subunit